MHCKDCKHWEPLAADDYDRMRLNQQIGYCNCEKFVYTGGFKRMTISSDVLAYQDMATDQAKLYTGADFGCIHFTPQQPTVNIHKTTALGWTEKLTPQQPSSAQKENP